MSQSRLSSFVEACINTLIGFILSIALSFVVYPLFGAHFTLAQNAGITAIFTIASIARGYIVRRYFNDRIHRAAMALAKE